MKRVFIAALVVALAGTAVFAGMQTRSGDMMDQTSVGDSLTAEQKAQIEAIQREYRVKIEAAETAEARYALRVEMSAKIRAILDEAGVVVGGGDPDGGSEDPDGDSGGDRIGDRGEIRVRREMDERRRGDMGAFGGPLAALRGVELTPEQREAVGALVERLNNALRTGLADILTEEQIAKLQAMQERMRRAGGSETDRRPSILELAGPLELTERQIAAITAIEERTKAAVEAAETREAKGAALEAGHAAIMEILTDAQRMKLRELQARIARSREGRSRDGGGDMNPFRLLGHLDLTEGQQAEVRAIMARANAAAEAAETPEAKREIMEGAMGLIKELLSPEQLEKLGQMMQRLRRSREGEGEGDGDVRRPGGILECAEEIGLSEEQIARIKQIQSRARAAAAETDDAEVKREIMQNAQERIMSVLTPEQIEKLRECLGGIRDSIPRTDDGDGVMMSPRLGSRTGAVRPGRDG